MTFFIIFYEMLMFFVDKNFYFSYFIKLYFFLLKNPTQLYYTIPGRKIDLCLFFFF